MAKRKKRPKHKPNQRTKAEKTRKTLKKRKTTRKSHRPRKALLGKKYSSERIVELVQARKVPQMIKHCVLKVQAKLSGRKSSSTTTVNEENFTGAFNICMNTFQTYGYMYKNSWSKMSFKGIKRNRRHLREATMNKMKNTQFLKLYKDSMDKTIDIYLEEKESRRVVKN